METFLLILGREDAHQRVQAAGDVLREVIPSKNLELKVEVVDFAKVQGAMAWVGPSAPDYQPLTTWYQGDQVDVIAYGDVIGKPQPAEVAARQYMENGADSLRHLDGAYTVVVVDRRRSTVHVRTDIVGVRSLNYTQLDNALMLSPQLVGLVASGLVKPRWDETTVASIVGIDWSVGRRSLLRGVSFTQPYQTLDWTPRGLQSQYSSPLELSTRPSDASAEAITNGCDQVVDQMVDSCRTFSESSSTIRISLTDGLDSRVILALLLGAGVRDKLMATTSGISDSPDVAGAAWLASLVGIPHVRREPVGVVSDTFLEHAKLLAFLDSGDGTSKRALSPMPSYRMDYTSIGGNGGEIYRGNYYPVFGLAGLVPNDPERFANTFVARLRHARFRGFDPAKHGYQERVTRRLAETLQTFKDLGARSADLADLLYLWERHGHWGAAGFRRPWARSWSPFASPSAIQKFYRLPAPLGKNNDVHARAIRRYLPLSAYLRRFNRSGWVPLQRAGNGFFLLRQFELAQKLAIKKVSKALKFGAEMQQLEQVWARILANDVYDAVHGLLSAQDSLVGEVFDRSVIERLLQQHRSSHGLLDTLGPMISVELCRLQVEQAHHLATKEQANVGPIR